MRTANAFNWKKIDPLLLLACLAPTPGDRERLLQRLISRYGMNRRTLVRRLDFLGARFLPQLLGPGALEAYERRMALIIRGYTKVYPKLRYVLMTNVERLRARQEARQSRAVSMREAAKILHVRPELLRSWIVDLGVMRLDENGRVPLTEIQHFFTSDWKWLLPAKRAQRLALRAFLEQEMKMLQSFFPRRAAG